MAVIVLYNPSDPTVAGRVTNFYPSAHTPDYVGNPNRMENPDLSGVNGVLLKYWKYDSGSELIVEMSQPEKDAIDASQPLSSPHVTTYAPTVSDDNTKGVSVGFIWVNSTNNESWICENAATGAAVWKPLYGGAAADNDVSVETTTNSWTTKVSIDLPASLSNENVTVHWYAELRPANRKRPTEWRIWNETDDVNLGEGYLAARLGVLRFEALSGFSFLSLNSNPKTISLQYRVTGKGNPSIRNARIYFTKFGF